MKSFEKLSYINTIEFENFDEIALCLTVKEIEAVLCFRILAKIQKIKMDAIFENFLKSCHIYFLNTLGVENFAEIALSLTVKEIEAFLCFRIFGENSKIQNGRHF